MDWRLKKRALALNDKGYISVDANYRTAVGTYLCGGGRDRISGAGVHFDGAGPRGGVPCVWIEVQAAGGFAAADGCLYDSGNFGGGRDGRELQGKGKLIIAWGGHGMKTMRADTSRAIRREC